LWIYEQLIISLLLDSATYLVPALLLKSRTSLAHFTAEGRENLSGVGMVLASSRQRSLRQLIWVECDLAGSKLFGFAQSFDEPRRGKNSRQ
jgi:hypothetical protein